MAFETPNSIDQENRKEDQLYIDGKFTPQNEPDVTDKPAETQSIVAPLVDEALHAVRGHSNAQEPSIDSSREVIAMKQEVETIRESVLALSSASSRAVKAEAHGLAATFDARLRAQPVAYLGLGVLVGYILGRRF